MSYAAVSRIASTLCTGFPNVCDNHKQETYDILRLIPELLADLEVLTAAARAGTPGYDDLHPADKTIAQSAALTTLAAAAVKITEGVLP